MSQSMRKAYHVEGMDCASCVAKIETTTAGAAGASTGGPPVSVQSRSSTVGFSDTVRQAMWMRPEG